MSEEHNKYTVSVWGSHPDSDNDDCWTGNDYESLRKALDAFSRPGDGFVWAWGPSAAYVELCRFCGVNGDGVEVWERLALMANPNFSPTNDDDLYDDWQSEWAMQQGMAHGCDAYNEAMGWSTEKEEA